VPEENSPGTFFQKIEKLSVHSSQLDFNSYWLIRGLALECRAIHPIATVFSIARPQDFYRYKTINQLINGFGVEKPAEPAGRENLRKTPVVIAGMSCRFPSSVETLTQFWDMLLSKEDQVKLLAGRGASEGGYLNDSITRFDHRYFNISPAEARTMDPQQILALELTEMLWKDAGIDPETLDRSRVGVYLGVWNQEYGVIESRSSIRPEAIRASSLPESAITMT
jgi:hypothetical protein